MNVQLSATETLLLLVSDQPLLTVGMQEARK